MAMRAAEAAYRKDGFDVSAGLFREAADTIDTQAAEIKRLRARLEINPKAPGYDGIECRDVTISEQDKLIDDLRADNKRLRETLAELVSIEDMKRRMAVIAATPSYLDFNELLIEYDHLSSSCNTRRQAAWNAARAALQGDSNAA